MNTFFFSTCIYIALKITLPQWGILFGGCRDLMLLDEMRILLPVPTVLLWEITPGALIEQQVF